LDAHTQFNSRVTTAHFDASDDCVGFYSMRLALENEIHLDKMSSLKRHAQNRMFAALQLEWLAVRREHQSKGTGTIMMGRVLDVFVRSVLEFGLPVMILVAANHRAASFYKKLGFEHYGGSGSMRMLLPAKSALDLYNLHRPTPKL
jgi:GNAT superfamily N-acetyltransferase